MNFYVDSIFHFSFWFNEVTKILPLRNLWFILQGKTGQKKRANKTHPKEKHAFLDQNLKKQRFQNEMSQTIITPDHFQ